MCRDMVTKSCRRCVRLIARGECAGITNILMYSTDMCDQVATLKIRSSGNQ